MMDKNRLCDVLAKNDQNSSSNNNDDATPI